MIGLADDLVSQGNLQAADWTYRKAGAYTSAAAVRNEIESILETEPILEEKPIEAVSYTHLTLPTICSV